MYNFLVYDPSVLLRDIRTELFQLDEILRWENNDEINEDREDILEWRNWVFSQMMPRQRKKPVIPPEEEYCGLW